ncbi:PIN domain-containing protein [Geopseudomonas aromaticivorans]
MRTNYVLIDLENVCPEHMELLLKLDFRVKVFVGSNQTKLPFELVTAMQALGERGEYIKIHGNGPNALDFHIAFYMGELAAKDEGCFFHVLSRDTGFDPLIAHLKHRKIFAKRSERIEDIPLLAVTQQQNVEQPQQPQQGKQDICSEAINFLRKAARTRPSKLPALENALKAHFRKVLGGNDHQKLVSQLRSKKIITVGENNSLTYHFSN